MPDWEYRKHFKFIGGTPGKGIGSLWECTICGKIVHASWGQAAKHYWQHIKKGVADEKGKKVAGKLNKGCRK